MITKLLPPLIIGDLKINVPIIQGGMGVKISTAALAGAVANCGGAGTIASVGLAQGRITDSNNYIEYSNKALQKEIRKARKLTKGVFGVNIMVALSNYEELVRTAVKEKVDYIISGAGLPLNLPKYTQGSSVKLITIVSSARSASIILKTWKRRYNRLPDAIIVEGPMAGGHLGFKADQLNSNTTDNLMTLVTDVIKTVKDFKADIPVIAAGGVYDGKDLIKFLELGAKGVQMGTRFVATEECPVSKRFKDLYVAAQEDDVIITQSPVGMPGRVLKTEFINRLKRSEKIPFKCNFHCLHSCDVKSAPYCIAQAMCSALKGDFDNSIVFAGSNVTRINKIVSVAELIKSIIEEAAECLIGKLKTKSEKN
ncbi:nitronate monooxygenase family protein [Lentisphaerota bacterium ZTH]|nr:nitronate monooxygenase [Lentisphaerota bacterium]WET05862.1 nitronate monooxygenase family protein [Lentisphaerota bacterium ZTH]